MPEAGWSIHLPSDAPSAQVDLLAAGSLPSAWSEVWAADPTRRLLWFEGDGWITSEQLEADSRAVAARLLSVSSPGDRVLLSGPTCYAFVRAYVGVLRAGMVCVPFNPAYTDREIDHIARDAAPRTAIVDDPARRSHLATLEPSLVVADLDCAFGSSDLPHDAPDPPDGDQGALLLYTSGTTGAPKGALLRHRSLLASSQAIRLAWRWSPSDCLVLALPLFHAHGLQVGLNGTLLAGASAVALPRFSPDLVLDAAADNGASLLFGVPTMYHRLAASGRADELHRFRLCVSGSAPLPRELFASIEERSGQRVLERYGMTETLMNTSNPVEGERRPGTVGLPLPGVEVRLADGDSDGEIQLRGPNVFDGYWCRPDADADAFDDGWFRTGDLGRFDEAGYLQILGRSKELIITGGLNVYPTEVEDVLLRSSAVAEAAVVGAPSDEWGETVVAFVVPADSAIDVTQLRDDIASDLAAFKVPREIHVVSELPRNALGKVIRSELRTRRS